MDTPNPAAHTLKGSPETVLAMLVASRYGNPMPMHGDPAHRTVRLHHYGPIAALVIATRACVRTVTACILFAILGWLLTIFVAAAFGRGVALFDVYVVWFAASLLAHGVVTSASSARRRPRHPAKASLQRAVDEIAHILARSGAAPHRHGAVVTFAPVHTDARTTWHVALTLKGEHSAPVALTLKTQGEERVCEAQLDPDAPAERLACWPAQATLDAVAAASAKIGAELHGYTRPSSAPRASAARLVEDRDPAEATSEVWSYPLIQRADAARLEPSTSRIAEARLGARLYWGWGAFTVGFAAAGFTSMTPNIHTAGLVAVAVFVMLNGLAQLVQHRPAPLSRPIRTLDMHTSAASPARTLDFDGRWLTLGTQRIDLDAPFTARLHRHPNTHTSAGWLSVEVLPRTSPIGATTRLRLRVAVEPNDAYRALEPLASATHALDGAGAERLARLLAHRAAAHGAPLGWSLRALD